jgi:SAM-dependent methyltransferase
MEQVRRGFWVIVSVVSIAGLLSTACNLNRLPDVHFEVTPQDVVEEMLEMAEVTKDDVVYDLGCGDGRFVITAAKKNGARGVGIDIDPKRVQESRKKAIEAGVTDRVRFIEDDLFTTHISEATVITLYLLQDLNLKLRPKLFRELKPGSRVVSYVFHMGDWKPDAMSPLGNGTSYFYVWVIPADVAGIWRGSVPTQKSDQPYTLRLKQSFQEISGYVTIQGGRRIRIKEAQLTGDRLSFTVKYEEANKQKVVMQFKGRVNGDTIHGNVEVTDGPFAGKYPWTAKRNP